MVFQVCQQTSPTGTYRDPHSGVQTHTVHAIYPVSIPNGQVINNREAQLPLKHPVQATQVHRYKLLHIIRVVRNMELCYSVITNSLKESFIQEYLFITQRKKNFM
jgi:hypothetical protein